MESQSFQNPTIPWREEKEVRREDMAFLISQNSLIQCLIRHPFYSLLKQCFSSCTASEEDPHDHLYDHLYTALHEASDMKAPCFITIISRISQRPAIDNSHVTKEVVTVKGSRMLTWLTGF